MLLYLKLLPLIWENSHPQTQQEHLTGTPIQSKGSHAKTIYPGEPIRHTIAAYYLERRSFL